MTLERLSPRQFEKFRKFIYAQSGIHIEPRKVTMLSNRIRRRFQASGCDSFDAYYQFLTSAEGTSELSGFLSAVTTNETFFFRTEKHFEWLNSRWLPEQIELHRSGARSNHLRILSAGCSDGAEAYSIAITLAENLYRLRGWSFEVLGTDISEATLEQARGGVYKSKSLEKVDERRRRRFFESIDNGSKWRVREAIRSNVQFENHNLMHSLSSHGHFDCIFLRNVLIYFDKESKQKALRHVIAGLSRGGHLVIGPSEGVFGMLDSLERVELLVYRKRDSKPNSDSATKHSSERRGRGTGK